MKRMAVLSALLFLAGWGALWAADVEGERLLRRIDAQMNFEGADFSARMSMIREDPEDGVDKMVVQQFRRDGNDQFVMLFLEPAVQKGQGYLRLDDNLWFYDPESRKFSHSSMKERFGGTDAHNSDFGASTLAEDYRLASMGEGTLGQHAVHILELEARHNEVTYPKRKLWVTRDQSLVLKTQDFSETGRLLRTSLFPGYARVDRRFVPTRLIFIDELVAGKKTSVSLAGISLSPLPDSVFTKAYIERVNR